MLPSLAIAHPAQVHQSPAAASRAGRPRLRLNTLEVTQPSTWTKTGTTSLRLETLSAVSPTARNTFSNAQGRLSSPSSPSSATLASNPATTTSTSTSSTTTQRPARPRLAIDSSVVSSKDPSTSDQHSPTVSASTLSAVSSDSYYSSSSAESVPAVAPYRPSYNLRSCLRNSPLPPAMSAATLVKRPMFPAPKRVSFRAPLDEEIRTTVYTVAHSELELEEGSTLSQSSQSSTSKPSSSSNNLARAVSDKATKPRSKPRVARLSEQSPKAGDKRSSDSEDSDSDHCPETPVAGRRKKQREWVWTLDPIVNDDERLPSPSPSPAFSSSGDGDHNSTSISDSISTSTSPSHGWQPAPRSSPVDDEVDDDRGIVRGSGP